MNSPEKVFLTGSLREKEINNNLFLKRLMEFAEDVKNLLLVSQHGHVLTAAILKVKIFL